jgi:hypothetical protein
MQNKFNFQVLAEKGEIYKTPQGNLKQISNKAPSHDDTIQILPDGNTKKAATGGVVLNDAHSVLSDSYTQVMNGDRNNSEMEQAVRISKKEGNDHFQDKGFDPTLKSSVSPSKFFLKAEEEVNKQAKKLSRPILTKDKFAFNSKKANEALKNALPTSEELYEWVFQIQESKKQYSDVDFNVDVAQFGRRPIIVNNPKDPRLQGYKDSLFIYNQEQKYNNLLKKLSSTYNIFDRGKQIDKLVNSSDFKKNIQLQEKLDYELPKDNFYIFTDKGRDFATIPTKPKQEIVYQPKKSYINTYGYKEEKEGSNTKFYDKPEYEKKYPPIYVTNPKDPRIGRYTEEGNQILYKTPAFKEKNTFKKERTSAIELINEEPIQSEHSLSFEQINLPEEQPFIFPKQKQYTSGQQSYELNDDYLQRLHQENVKGIKQTPKLIRNQFGGEQEDMGLLYNLGHTVPEDKKQLIKNSTENEFARSFGQQYFSFKPAKIKNEDFLYGLNYMSNFPNILKLEESDLKNQNVRRAGYLPIDNTIILPKKGQFKNSFLPELAHAYQYNSPNPNMFGKWDEVPYSSASEYDAREYSREGSLENQAHYKIDNYFDDVVFSEKEGLEKYKTLLNHDNNKNKILRELYHPSQTVTKEENAQIMLEAEENWKPNTPYTYISREKRKEYESDIKNKNQEIFLKGRRKQFGGTSTTSNPLFKYL